MKPILFNTEMAKALLNGRKTVTRRVVKPQPTNPRWNQIGWLGWDDGHGYKMRQPYQPGDILYVPGAWKCRFAMLDPDGLGYEVIFRDGQHVRFRFETEKRAKKWVKYARKPQDHWQSPYFMPREAARIFLRVKDVKVERLQDIDEVGAKKEGLRYWNDICRDETWHPTFYDPDSGGCPSFVGGFSKLWDSTIKSADRAVYSWAANPWVWVIEFERISREEVIA